MDHIAIIGRLPALSIVELEALLGPNNIQPYSDEAVLLQNLPPDEQLFERLGGTLKLAKILSELPRNWREIEAYLLKSAPVHASSIAGKLSFGLSAYGLGVSAATVNKTALLVKKAIKKSGKSVRVVPNNEAALSSAQVLHNKLAHGTNWELLIVSDGKTAYLAQTTDVQNITAYAARDQKRPKRDSRVGMLPPKLAQTIVNLAAPSPGQKNPPTILDPFCGTGVLLQEACLMGFSVYGSDLEPRMIDYTRENLTWLFNKTAWQLEVGDATTHQWQLFDTIACETYLGPPLTEVIDEKQLDKLVYGVNKIHEAFLRNIALQCKPGTRLCLAVPAWRTARGVRHLPTLDKLQQLGYNELKFQHAPSDQLIYSRPDQLVMRQLIVLVRK